VSKRVVVFRFDRDPLVCRDRVRWLRRLNPGVPIYGLYGGPTDHRRLAFRVLGRRYLGLDGLYLSPRAGRWNWRHGDLALAAWFREVGSRLDFDVLHHVEWDILLLAPLAEVFGHVGPDEVGLTAVTPVREVEASWEWLAGPAEREEWAGLLAHARDTWGDVDEPVACLAGGACFPRAFLEQYAQAQVPELCHDEIRLPLFAQTHGFEVVDTRLRRGWPHREVDDAFSLGSTTVDASFIHAELAKPSGRRVFHPVRTVWRGRTARQQGAGTRWRMRWYDAASGVAPSFLLASGYPWL
jgi:hypothetical protein